MDIQPDFSALLELFNAHHVEYVVVGGYALAAHGAPRYTGDIDILVESTPANARRVLAALHEFGFASLGLTTDDFERPAQVVQLGHPPVRIDIMTSISGVSWAEAASGRIAGAYGKVPVAYLGRPQLVANKRASGRPKDLADLDALGEK